MSVGGVSLGSSTDVSDSGSSDFVEKVQGEVSSPQRLGVAKAELNMQSNPHQRVWEHAVSGHGEQSSARVLMVSVPLSIAQPEEMPPLALARPMFQGDREIPTKTDDGSEPRLAELPSNVA